jgi:hypothetical protein
MKQAWCRLLLLEALTPFRSFFSGISPVVPPLGGLGFGLGPCDRSPPISLECRPTDPPKSGFSSKREPYSVPVCQEIKLSRAILEPPPATGEAPCNQGTMDRRPPTYVETHQHDRDDNEELGMLRRRACPLHQQAGRDATREV